MNRRSLLTSAAVLLAARNVALPAWISPAQAEAAWRHGVSKFGELKYPAGFKQFDYVNAKAPKGGAASQIALGGFDNLNMVVAGVKGALAQGVDLLHDTLFVSALDEVASVYGLLAESVSFPDDVSSATYKLRAEAKWNDGKPVTPEDVIFSFEAFKKNSPQAGASYAHVLKAEKTGEREVKFTFDGTGNRELPQVVGQLTILPKHWWEGTDANGKKRSIAETTLEPPLGSGPYRVKELSPGHNIVYERVKDYWGQKLNVNVGRDNFDELRFEYFRDATVAIEAFKANTVDWRSENSAKNWATAYDFPAAKDAASSSRSSRSPIWDHAGLRLQHPARQVQGSARSASLQLCLRFHRAEQAAVLRAIQTHRQLFRGHRIGGDRRAAGRELALLETVRDQVPADLFKKPYTNPANGDARGNQREALKLFRQAGYEIQNQQLVNAKTGEPFTIELLSNSPLFERIFLYYKPRSKSSASRSRCARSTRPVRETACAAGTSTSSFMPGVNRCCPATSCAASSARRRPTSRAPKTSSASRTRRSTP